MSYYMSYYVQDEMDGKLETGQGMFSPVCVG